MNQKVIIDTDILIDFGLDDTDAIDTLAYLEKNYDMGVSVITAMELYTGCRSKKDLSEVEDLLSGLELHWITQTISEKGLSWMKEFRASHGVEINDMLIAGTAFINEIQLISKNQKHYRFLPDLKLLEFPL